MEVVRTKFSTVLKNSYKLGKKNCLNNLTSEQKLKKIKQALLYRKLTAFAIFLLFLHY